MVKPTISGRIIDRRDHVLIGRLLLVSMESATFLARWWSMKGPFLIDLAMFATRYLLDRERRMYLSVRLLLRVL